MANPGKEFEKDFKNSIPPEIWNYRLRDGTASWDMPEKGEQGGKEQASDAAQGDTKKNNGVRFQQSNICDFILFWDGALALHELKSHKGKSLPHKDFMNSRGDIKHLPELREAAEHDGIYAGALINMREVGETYYLPADIILNHIYGYYGNAKSIPIAFMREKGYLVGAEKKRTRYRYDIKDLMNHLKYD